MSWTNPPNLSAEDRLLTDLKQLPPRDQTIMISLLTFYTMTFDLEKKPSRDHFRDLGWALLTSCKHAAEMDVLKFLEKELAAAPPTTTLAEVQETLRSLVVSVAIKAEERLDEAKKLITLLETTTTSEEKPNASK